MSQKLPGRGCSILRKKGERREEEEAGGPRNQYPQDDTRNGVRTFGVGGRAAGLGPMFRQGWANRWRAQGWQEKKE